MEDEVEDDDHDHDGGGEEEQEEDGDDDDDDDCRLVERSVCPCTSHAHSAVLLSKRHNTAEIPQRKKEKNRDLNEDRNSKNKTKFGGAGVSQAMTAPFSSAHG